jgi:molybdate transport system regulatory protein
MDDASGRGRAALIEDGTEFVERDAVLLRTINRTGSIARAATELGRSRAHALSRIETLEASFGTLVERTRGGQGGGGSRVTDAGLAILDRYERLESVLATAASVPETVVRGTVTETHGELAAVDTPLGTVQGVHDDRVAGDPVQVRIGADAVILYDDIGTEATSARNRRLGTVTAIDAGETVLTVTLAVEGVSVQALVTGESASLLDLDEGQDVALTWKATATRVTRETDRT